MHKKTTRRRKSHLGPCLEGGYKHSACTGRIGDFFFATPPPPSVVVWHTPSPHTNALGGSPSGRGPLFSTSSGVVSAALPLRNRHHRNQCIFVVTRKIIPEQSESTTVISVIVISVVICRLFVKVLVCNTLLITTTARSQVYLHIVSGGVWLEMEIDTGSAITAVPLTL
ncbi:hypothetical protein PR048_013057 [Dryococelus australis]|uniref:Uncharacterized protein n=1 Tax=Dryococelus australis TaxID=614101 RepID=A0ABQ9HR44_9NEOP|nr:hypothetical protein PR048_013057 [Dryococelus australis]